MNKEQLATKEQLAEAELQLAIARRRAGLCIYCGNPNLDADDGYLGGSCEDCLRDMLAGTGGTDELRR